MKQPKVYEFLPDCCSTREQRLEWVTNYDISENKGFLLAKPNIGDQKLLRLGIIFKETGEFIGFCNTGTKEEVSEPKQEIAYVF